MRLRLRLRLRWRRRLPLHRGGSPSRCSIDANRRRRGGGRVGIHAENIAERPRVFFLAALMQQNEQVGGAVGFAHDLGVVGGGDLAEGAHCFPQEGERGAAVDCKQGADDLEGDVGDLVPGADGGDHFAGGAQAGARQGEGAVEQLAGDAGVEGAEAPVQAEHEVALREDEGWLDVDDVEDGGEGGFQAARVLGLFRVEAFRDGEEIEDLRRAVGRSGRGWEGGCAVQDDSGPAELEGDPHVQVAGHAEEPAADFWGAGRRCLAEGGLWQGLEMETRCLDEVHQCAAGHPGNMGGCGHAQVRDSQHPAGDDVHRRGGVDEQTMLKDASSGFGHPVLCGDGSSS